MRTRVVFLTEFNDIAVYIRDITDRYSNGLFIVCDHGAPGSHWVGHNEPGRPEEVAAFYGAELDPTWKPPIVTTDPAVISRLQKAMDGGINARISKYERELSEQLRAVRDQMLVEGVAQPTLPGL